MDKATPCAMASGKAPPALLLIAASMLLQSCVEYYPAAATYPPPQPPSPVQYAAGPAPQPAPEEAAPAPRPLSATDQLIGPIALYPDPLLALILPASTAPADISAASAYLIQYGDMTRVDSQPWDPSVRALAHYPAIISWMAENIEWTRALGSAFLSSPAAVMESVQRLRARALAAGALASNAHQQVVHQDGTIEIFPAEPDWVYAPSYDTDVVYSEEPYDGYGGPFVNFGPALLAGPWLSYGFDWSGCVIWAGGWGAWHGPGGWHHPRFDRGHGPPGAHPWHPPPKHPGFSPPDRGSHGNFVPLPRPLVDAPRPPPSHFGKPGTRVSPQDSAPGSAVPSPRTAAPPMDRPRLGQAIEPPGKKAQAAEPGPRSAPSVGKTEARGNGRTQESAPAAAVAKPAASAPASQAAPSHSAAPSAAPAAASAPSQAAGTKNH